jgi:hypothetical protein
LVVVVRSEIRLEYPSWAIETTTLNLSVGEGGSSFLDAAAGGVVKRWEGFDPASRRVSRFSSAQAYQAASPPRVKKVTG